MIKFVKYKEIDFHKYENCLKSAAQNSNFAEKDFLDIVTKSKWFLLIYKDYEAVMPVFYARRFGFNFVLMPKLCPQLGVFSKKNLPEINELFLNFLKANFLVLNYHFNAENKFHQLLKTKTSYLIKKQNYTDVLKKYSASRRRNVRINQALTEKMTFKSNFTEDSKIFFLEHLKGTKNKKESADYFDILINLQKKNIGNLMILEYNEVIQSIVFLFTSKENVYLSIFINTNILENANIPSIAIDQILQKFIEKNNFDFVGSDLENVAKFNQRFGAFPYQYSVINYSKFTLLKKIPFGYRIFTNFAP